MIIIVSLAPSVGLLIILIVSEGKRRGKSKKMREVRHTKNISRMLGYSSVSVQKWLELIERTCDLMVELEVVQVVKEERERDGNIIILLLRLKRFALWRSFFLLLVLDVQFS